MKLATPSLLCGLKIAQFILTLQNILFPNGGHIRKKIVIYISLRTQKWKQYKAKSKYLHSMGHQHSMGQSPVAFFGLLSEILKTW